jgi:hypothetical protein
MDDELTLNEASELIGSMAETETEEASRRESAPSETAPEVSVEAEESAPAVDYQPQNLQEAQQAMYQADQFMAQEWEQIRQIESQLPRLKQTDRQAYERAVAEMTERRHALDNGIMMLNQYKTEFADNVKKHQESVLTAEKAALLRAIPEWSDPEQAKVGKAEVKSYLKRKGFSDAEIDGIADHRVIATAWQAMRAEQAAPRKPKAELPKRFRKKSAPSVEERLAKRNIRNMHSVEAAAERMRDLI